MKNSNQHTDTIHPTNPETIACKNCGHLFTGNYCSHCGQSVKDFEKPIQLLFIDFAGNLFAFDTRVWKSLKHILFYPGKMERQYLEGKRKRYMPPFRMYVFASFLFFLTLSFATDRIIRDNKADSKLEISSEEIDDNGKIQYPDSLPQTEISGENIAAPFPANSKIDIPFIMNRPEFYMARVFKYLSWVLFILMPLYGFLLWWNFRKSRQFFIGHFLLSVNQHVFFFALTIVVVWVQFLLPQRDFQPEKYLFFLFPLYAWLGAHRLYRRRWFSTTLRMMVVLFVYGIIAFATSIGVLYFSLV